MQERIKNILNQVIGRGHPFLKGIQKVDNQTFELKTAWSEHNHHTWLEYELLSDNQMATIKIAHIFGHLELKPNMTPEDMFELSKQLLNLMWMNVNSFQTSSAYLGIRYLEPRYYVSLHDTLIFLSKWQDEDIAEALYGFFFQLNMGLIFEPPPPIKFWEKPSQKEVAPKTTPTVIPKTTHKVADQLFCGKISATTQIAERQLYPFGAVEFKKFFENFLEMSFEFPKDFGSIFIYDAKENAPRHSYAVGWIFAESLDDLEIYVERNDKFPQSLGEIRFEYGGNIETPRITVEKR